MLQIWAIGLSIRERSFRVVFAQFKVVKLNLKLVRRRKQPSGCAEGEVDGKNADRRLWLMVRGAQN
jgi:hypothetical protein